jgi:hypothetical protein
MGFTGDPHTAYGSDFEEIQVPTKLGWLRRWAFSAIMVPTCGAWAFLWLAALARSGLLVTTWRTVSISRTPMLPKTSPPCRPALPLARTRPQHRSARNERRGPTDYLRTGTDHIQSWKEDPARYQAALLAFLRNLS